MQYLQTKRGIYVNFPRNCVKILEREPLGENGRAQ